MSQNKSAITRRSSPQAPLAGQFVSRSFVVLLRKSIPQNHDLQTAAELGVILGSPNEDMCNIYFFMVCLSRTSLW